MDPRVTVRGMPRLVCLSIAVLALLAAAGAAAAPIADPSPTTLPPSVGAAATAKPLPATRAPQNPFMARNPNSNIHNDTWMTDAYARRGPLGANPLATSSAMPPALCGSIAFDKQGRIVSVCP